MELEIYSAFIKAGISEQDAKAAVDSISKEIDKRYAVHSQQLSTRGDVETVRKELAEAEAKLMRELASSKTELMRSLAEYQRWTVMAMFGAVGIFAAIAKIWQ